MFIPPKSVTARRFSFIVAASIWTRSRVQKTPEFSGDPACKVSMGTLLLPTEKPDEPWFFAPSNASGSMNSDTTLKSLKASIWASGPATFPSQ